MVLAILFTDLRSSSSCHLLGILCSSFKKFQSTWLKLDYVLGVNFLFHTTFVHPHSLSLSQSYIPTLCVIIVKLSWSVLQILLQYYNSSLERDEVTKKIIKFGAVACILGGLKANFSNSAPKIMYYSARGPDPEDSFLDDADIMKPNLVAPGNSIWAAWSSLGTDSVEFQGIHACQ